MTRDRRRTSDRHGAPRAASATPPPPPAPGPSRALLPTLAELLDLRQPFLMPILLLIAARAAFWALLPYASEDAYIAFRYARHLATGNGLSYNPGERVMGFTSPLWTVWSAAGYALLGDPLVWARGTTLLFDLATLLLMSQMLRRSASQAAAWCFAVFFAAWPFFSATAVSGLESNALLGLIVLGAALVERGGRAAPLALGALAWIRPEGVVAAAVLALAARWRDRLLAAGLAALGWGALALYYGSPVPQSVIAKADLYGTPGPWAGRHWWEWLVPLSMGRAPVAEGAHLQFLTVLAAPALVAGAIALWPRRGEGLARAIAAALVVWLGYALLGVAYFFWYLVVPLGGLAALASVGLPRLLRSRLVYATLAVGVLGAWTSIPLIYLGRAQNEYFGFGAVAEYLLQNATPGQKVLLEPIGMVGYRCPLVVVDEVGLVAPRVAKRRLAGSGWYSDVVAAERPDWVVVRRGVIRTGAAFAGAGAPFRDLAERDSLLARYAVASVADTVSGDNALLILRRAR